MELHLAALENVSCWAFRNLCKGATDTYTGMLSLNNLVKRNNAWKEVDTYSSSQRQWIQIATSKETECAEFIKRLQSELEKNPEKDNVYGIQLNASCPSPALIRIGQGPALIKRTTKIINLLKELLKSKYKASLKVRLGLNQQEVEQRKILSLFEQLEKIKNPNFTGVSVHFKHAQQKSDEKYNYSILPELLKYNVPIVVNGGITKTDDLKNFRHKNIVGVMIGREAMQNPDVFLQIKNELEGNEFIKRDVKKEFDSLCLVHAPKPIYLETIKKYCEWAKE